MWYNSLRGDFLFILFDDTENEIRGIFSTQEDAEKFAEDNYKDNKTWTQEAPDHTKKG